MNEKAVIKALEDIKGYLFLMGGIFTTLDILRVSQGVPMNLNCAVMALLGWGCVLRFLSIYKENKN